MNRDYCPSDYQPGDEYRPGSPDYDPDAKRWRHPLTWREDEDYGDE